MKLFYSPASPFARKCRVIVHELGLKLEEISVNPIGNEELRRVNPLGKVPALVLDDGSALIDSAVICEYLNDLGGGRFFPGTSPWRGGSGRWRALGLQALADGMADAAVALMQQRRLPEERRNDEAMARHRAALTHGLDALARMKFAEVPTIGEIAAACVLGYLDLRLPDLDWRAARPELGAWYEAFARYPAMQATAPG